MLFFAALNAHALTISDITVIGTNSASGAVTVGATMGGAVGQGFATFQVTTTDGLGRRYFPPTQVVGTSWTNNSWNPYFTGSFVVDITAFDYSGNPPVTASTTVTITRAVSGTINGLKYQSPPYDANGVWSNVDLSLVKLHDIGLNQDAFGVGSIGCNLLNADVTDDPDWSDEQRDIAYTDTSAYKPAGTAYRFDVSLHARPRGFMGMGEIKRWIWSPYDTNSPDGPGVLAVDITSCSPWRSSYSNALQSHVGFAPLFAPSNFAMMPTGMIQCTSAHYMDVGPTNAGDQTEMRAGLRVNGHTGTNSYLKTFLSDTFLRQQFGLTNVQDATNLMAGFVQHFNTNGIPIDDVAEVTATFTRIEGGTNLIYDYNFDGIGDSGYEARLNFEFHSAVNAQIGMALTNQTYSYSMLAADFDGDAKADPAIFNTNGNWKIKLSSANYATIPLTGFLGGASYTALAADFDGDRKADPAIYNADLELWAVKLSSLNYLAPTVLTGFGGAGWQAVAGDFDGDAKADPGLYNTNPSAGSGQAGTWKVKLSTAGYQTITAANLLGYGGCVAIAADFDRDGKVDPAVYSAASGSWIVVLSSMNYGTAIVNPWLLGSTGYFGVGADFDGDAYADPAVAMPSTGNWKVRLSSGNYTLIDLQNFLGE